jgi:hypothetical protein
MDIFVINRDDPTKINDIDIIDAYEVKDKKLRRFIYAPLCGVTSPTPLHTESSKRKFYIETNAMKVTQVNVQSNYIMVSPNDVAKQIFNKLDDKTLELLQILCNEHVDFMNVSENSDDLDFIPIVEPDTNYIKIKFDKESEIKCKGKDITINDVAEGDTVKMLIFVESINVYPDENVAYNRLHIAFTDVTKEMVKHKREKLSNHVFHSSAEDSCMDDVIMDDYDMSYIHTEKLNFVYDDNVANEVNAVNVMQTIKEDAEDETTNIETPIIREPTPPPPVAPAKTVKRKQTNERKPRKPKASA